MSNYLGSAARIQEDEPELFPTRRSAQEYQDFYFNTQAGRCEGMADCCTPALAHKEHYLE